MIFQKSDYQTNSTSDNILYDHGSEWLITSTDKHSWTILNSRLYKFIFRPKYGFIELRNRRTFHSPPTGHSIHTFSCCVFCEADCIEKTRTRVRYRLKTKKFKKSTVTNHRNANSDSMTSFYKLDLLMINHEEFL